MAQRRMFSKTVTNSSEFLMMSQSAQNLYFHFGMNADDDGFCEVFTIMRMTESKPDDLRSLHERGFLYIVDSKVCIIKDWHENNQMRADRYKQSSYLSDPKFKELYLTVMEDKIKEITQYQELLTDWQPNGNQLVPQVRLGKDSIGKVRLGKVRLGKDSIESETSSEQINEVIKKFESINPACKKNDGTQANNLYTLTAKNVWKSKPTDSQSIGKKESDRQTHSPEPTDSDDSSRQTVVLHNNTNNNNTNITRAETSSAEVITIIDLFKEINPEYDQWYKNTTQRKAVKELIEKYGFEKVSNMVTQLPQIIARKFAPKITTPYELKRDLAKLLLFIKHETPKVSKIGTLQ